jgi:hypothetical protein
MTMEGHLAGLDESYHGEMDFKDKLRQSMDWNRNKICSSNLLHKNKKPVKEAPPALAPVSKENLDRILSKLSTPFNAMLKNQVTICIKQNSFQWLADLSDLFTSLEMKREESTTRDVADKTEKIGQIFKALIQLADPAITEAILSEKFFTVSLGALEQLPELHGQLLCREFFEKVQFKEVVPINNEAIIKKIHTNYRVNYLRETIFAKEEGPVV